MSEAAIQMMDVGYQSDGDTWLLQGVSATLERGRTAAVIGPSGAGKSTLLSLCNLLRTPSTGRIEVAGKEIRDWPVQLLRQKVGMVFQAATMFPGTVEDNVLFGLRLHNRPLTDAGRLLELVDLPRGLLTKPATDLSGGQQQRVALARTLAMEPDVLLLDEVTSALDVHAKREVEETLLEIRSRLNTTMLWVTHDLRQARRVADDIWFLVAGRLVEDGPAERLLVEPATSELRSFLAQAKEGEA
ncbi:putative ABC transport system ATP-binding protein [Alicyclobacillus sacchari]|uniref:Putative ABC transport system ATP-binding protein n=1 Tax=Alicyclobacillus sacchari TaxID=392010 RepID=A0A4R8LTP2_9BACL|nr:phosphate ABC transporter ATP-binding protein [Alicyclobacillus sacchari]TDY50155.1 putative ABC transport system ATP-binding protein [Alicyclobacillus sacchari]GMA57473.1 putative ABC transporter ATP-binding protein YjkB [Alicyclobacillus sacchari]